MDTAHAAHRGQAITAVRPRRMGALPVVFPILTALEVRSVTNDLVPSQADIDLGQVLVLLVLNRLLSPKPLYRVGEWLAETVLPDVLEIAPQQLYDNRLGRALDRLCPHLGELWSRLAARAVQVYDLDLHILHWDITSLYFEGLYAESAVATYGYSRSPEATDTKQINLEVDVAHDGSVPIQYQVLAGNTADITRPLPHLEALLRFLTRPELAARHLRPLLISDSKMVTPEAVLAYHRHRLCYLGPLPNGTATDAVLRSVAAEELTAHLLGYRPQRVKAEDSAFIPYQGVWRPVTFEHEGQRVTDRALVVWSAGKQHLDIQKRKTYLKRLLNGLAHIQEQLNTRRYKKRSYVEQRLVALQQGQPAKSLVDIQLSGEDGALVLGFRINRRKLAEAQALDGRYALATNAEDLEASQALTLFKGQDGVEKRFRTSKGPLQVHPLFVHTDGRIQGVVFITLVALLVRALLERTCRQRGLGMTADRLFEGFGSLQAVDLTWQDGSRQRVAAEMTPFQAGVLSTLGWPNARSYAGVSPLGR